jgi:hypothetical protein
MGSSKHPPEYQTLSRQIEAINKLPFSRELRNRMIERAKAIWHHEDADQLYGTGAYALPWERVGTERSEIRP